ncbi:QCR10 subunit of the ubiqunol-cytochrome c oxidoreductase complex [Agaricus bisporus var. burnettii JB137-S8]|uniref:QCR10 subunit of the ubiqunol-cytochrome c oxidoreductase complex n=2 Tax=Agaricus bisporus var. burnettii TaxID=192524 RepID=K5Y468_AGABU|nr:QCR10 subunit of the ubiqunol-cytochrome c oxidoreductase complex [Agaricus bisporus var. burnettii JB137-S8]EKM82810.1 QCR10 subunit of the ubiqunol-cytochrome c oxidoreductase complex [Agaricus bisporus var. burnettii JB137-S8]KAF7778848.1 hypothetical protein Agabi119p4_3193 [Agaricus bisporus var. burnettii]
MARVVFKTQAPVNAALAGSRRWLTTLGIWGFSAGAGALLLLSVTPLVRREVLVKVPMLGNYYEDKTPESDKPF